MSTYQTDYDFPAATLHGRLTDKAWVSARARAAGDTDVGAQLHPVGGGVEVVLDRDVLTDVPSFAKRLFKATNRVVERSTWTGGDGRFQCNWTVDVKGAPTEISGATTLLDTPGGCRMTIDFTVRASVPLIRKRLEAFITDRTLDGMKRDAEYNRAHIR